MRGAGAKTAAFMVPRYLLLFFFSTVVLVLFAMAVNSASISDIPSHLASLLLPATVASIFLSFSALPDRKVPRFFAFLQIAATSSILLIFGTLLLESMCGICDGRRNSLTVPSGAIIRVDEGALFVLDGEDLRGIVNYRREIVPGNPELPSLEAFVAVTAHYSPDTGALLDANDETLRVLSSDPIGSRLFLAGPFLRGLFADIRAISTYLLGEENVSRFVTTAISIMSFAGACMFFSRFSRWSLINFIISILMFRAVFLLFDLFTGDLIANLTGGMQNNQAAGQLPALLFFSLAILLLIVDLLFGREEK